MKLDDRPVIDQLLNPTPLNVLYDVQETLDTWLDNVGSAWPTGEVAGAARMLTEFVNAMEERL